MLARFVSILSLFTIWAVDAEKLEFSQTVKPGTQQCYLENLADSV